MPSVVRAANIMMIEMNAAVANLMELDKWDAFISEFMEMCLGSLYVLHRFLEGLKNF